jgi:hypothetical protein
MGRPMRAVKDSLAAPLWREGVVVQIREQETIVRRAQWETKRTTLENGEKDTVRIVLRHSCLSSGCQPNRGGFYESQETGHRLLDEEA